MSGEKPGGKIADNQPNRDQSQPSEAPNIPSGGRNNDGEKNSGYSNKNSEPKKHSTFEWVNLVFLVFTFTVACIAAYQAKRLADLTYNLVVDARQISNRQARLIIDSQWQYRSGGGQTLPTDRGPEQSAQFKSSNA